MTTKTVSWVAPMGEPDDRGNRYITVKFHDGDTAYIGKKDLDAAIEVRGLLEETVDLERDFTLEDTGKKTKDGNTRWKIKAFGPYQPTPYVPGGGSQAPGREAPSTESRTASASPTRSTEESIARAVALKAAAIAAQGLDTKRILVMAEEFEAWLKDSAGPSLPADQAGGDATPSGDPPATNPQGPDAPAVGAVQGEGEASCPPHQLNLDVAAKAGRYPCRKCGAYVNPRAGYTE